MGTENQCSRVCLRMDYPNFQQQVQKKINEYMNELLLEELYKPTFLHVMLNFNSEFLKQLVTKPDSF